MVGTGNVRTFVNVFAHLNKMQVFGILNTDVTLFLFLEYGIKFCFLVKIYSFSYYIVLSVDVAHLRLTFIISLEIYLP